MHLSQSYVPDRFPPSSQEEYMPTVKVNGKTKKIKYGNKKPMRKPKGK